MTKGINGLFLMMLLAASAIVFPTIGECVEPPKETQTVEWFMRPENKEILTETLKQCRNNPGELKDTPNCVNAEEAKRRRWGQRAGVPKF